MLSNLQTSPREGIIVIIANWLSLLVPHLIPNMLPDGFFDAFAILVMLQLNCYIVGLHTQRNDIIRCANVLLGIMVFISIDLTLAFRNAGYPSWTVAKHGRLIESLFLR